MITFSEAIQVIKFHSRAANHKVITSFPVYLSVSQLIVSRSTKNVKSYRKFLVSDLAVHYSSDSKV